MSRYNLLNEIQKEFIDYCTDIIMSDQNNRKKVPVICSPCGIGKTTTIKELISKVLEDKELPGMIFVTDTIKALEDVAAEHLNDISLLTQENLSTELTAQKEKKVLLMTSQRYFNMIAEEINQLLFWDGGRRTKIIIDERAQVFRQTNINLKNLNDIDTAIENGIDNQYPEEKAWCKDQWRKLRQHLEDAMYSYEQLCTGRLELWHNDSWGSITDDNTRFYGFLEKYRTELNIKYQLFFTDLQAVAQIVTDGAIFYCQKRKKRVNAKSSEKYDKSFSVIRDNSSSLNNVAADVYVLDATADITPDYQLPYFDIIKNPKFDMDLSCLNIKIIDVQTSKQAITVNTPKAKKRIATIKKIIEEEKSGNSKTAIFTYTETESQFMDVAYEDKTNGIYTGHFGRLHGSNKYRNADLVAHVGLNRQPHINYFLIDSVINSYNELQEIKKKSLLEQVVLFNDWMKPSGKIALGDTMMKSLLVDFEQNIFRSAIRNRDNTKVTVLLFCDCRVFRKLIYLMRGRYEKLGATIIEIVHPAFGVSDALARKGETNTQKIIKWLKQQKNGTVFKIAQMKKETGLTDKNVDKVKENNKSIHELFDQMKTQKRGYYQIKVELLDSL